MVLIRLNEEEMSHCKIYNSVCQTCHFSRRVLEGPALSFLASLTLKSRALWPEGTVPGPGKDSSTDPPPKACP